MLIFKRKTVDRPDAEGKRVAAANIERTQDKIDDTSLRIARIQAQVRVLVAQRGRP